MAGYLPFNHYYPVLFWQTIEFITFTHPYFNSDRSFGLSNELLGNANVDEAVS